MVGYSGILVNVPAGLTEVVLAGESDVILF